MENLINALEFRGFVTDYEPGHYLNIARQDGIHCEFYPFGGDDDIGLCATYNVNGIETEIDELLDSRGVDNMIDYIETILKKN